MSPFVLTVKRNAHVWTLPMLQRLRCMYWLDVPTPAIAADLGLSPGAVLKKANNIGLYRSDEYLKRLATEAGKRSCGHP